MKLFRYIMFIPAAIIASFAGGFIGYTLGNMGLWIYEGSLFLAWLFSGIGSALAFMSVGLQVAPVRSKKVKWALLSILFAVGLLTVLGGLIGDKNSIICGIAIIACGVIFVKIKDDLTI